MFFNNTENACTCVKKKKNKGGDVCVCVFYYYLLFIIIKKNKKQIIFLYEYRSNGDGRIIYAFNVKNKLIFRVLYVLRGHVTPEFVVSVFLTGGGGEAIWRITLCSERKYQAFELNSWFERNSKTRIFPRAVSSFFYIKKKKRQKQKKF